MAKRVEKFPELSGQSQYPWDEWLDGSIWELESGEDFKGKPASFRSIAIGQSKRRGGKVKTRLIRGANDGADRLYIQFMPDEPQTRMSS